MVIGTGVFLGFVGCCRAIIYFVPGTHENETAFVVRVDVFFFRFFLEKCAASCAPTWWRISKYKNDKVPFAFDSTAPQP